MIDLKKNEEMVSVIIPMYNSAAFMKKCVDSIIGQTYENLEIILVNDCSVDETLSICYMYAEKDKRIKVYSLEKNYGASHARNIGLDNAKGEYLMFVDSDNYIDSKMIESMISCAKNKDADIVACGYYLNEKRSSNKDELIIITQEQIFNKYVQTLGWSVCTKLFKKIVLCNVRFDENVYTGEDILFSIKVMKSIYLKKIVFMSTPYYHIVTRENSLGNTKTIRNYKSYIYVMEEVLKEYKERDIQDMVEKFSMSQIGATVSLLRMMYEDNYPNNEIKKYRDNIIKNIHLAFISKFPIKLRIGLLMQLLPININKLIWSWK